MRLFSFWQPALLVTVFLSSCALPQVDTSPGGTDPVTSSSEPSTEIDTSFAGPHPPDISSATTIPTFSFLTVEQNAFVIAEVARMDLRQKIGQMTQVSADMVCKGNLYELTVPYEFDEEKLRKVFVDYQVGSILNYPTNNYLVPAEWYVFMQRLQRMALQNGDVPLLYGQDAIHGPNYVYGATLFPQPLGLAATFNRDLARESAAVCAYEMKAASIPWNFSPAMDLGRSPVWPRIWESFGEDLYLNQEMGLASLQGYQGDDLTDLGSVAACLKHFTGYGNPASGRDRTPAYIPERQLREYHLPQYQTAIDAGALSIMISSAEINGIPSHANKELLTDILRGEMGFEGLVVSDWADFNKLIYTHRVAADIKEATRMAVLAGIDMCMVPVSFDFCDALYELVEEGSVPMFRIDEAVSRVLAVKVAMGLYEQNNWNPVEFPLFGGTQHQALSRSAAEEAVVLLKNEELLPLSSDTRVLITGPSANTMRSLLGGWSGTWQAERADEYFERHSTLVEAIREELTYARTNYVPSVEFGEAAMDLAPVMVAAADAEVIVICLGESSYTENPGNINDLELPESQIALVNALATTGKKLAFVLTEGRPRVISKIEQLADAILYTAYPGPYGGEAVSGILSGRVNPSGKLPLTYPRETNSLVLYDHKFTEGGVHGEPNTDFWPQYEFGHGLSYSRFEYSDLQLKSSVLRPGEDLSISVTVTNTSDRAGKEAVLLFSQDEVATITPSVRRLRDFSKIELEAGASQVVNFSLRPEDVSFIGLDQQPITEPGWFTIMVGDQKVRFEYRE